MTVSDRLEELHERQPGADTAWPLPTAESLCDRCQRHMGLAVYRQIVTMPAGQVTHWWLCHTCTVGLRDYFYGEPHAMPFGGT
jgi:hypothetical protein